MMATGVVSKWIDDRGYGFLKVDGSGESLFFHATGIVDEQWAPAEGDAVTFEPGTNSRDGRRLAEKVRPA
jgi:cold shock CspA family protein